MAFELRETLVDILADSTKPISLNNPPSVAPLSPRPLGSATGTSVDGPRTVLVMGATVTLAG